MTTNPTNNAYGHFDPHAAMRAMADGDAEPLILSWATPPAMVGLSVKNFLLKIITLGIYGFWGRTEVRHRIWSAARINAEPLQYTGTGKELFLGFLIVLGVLLVPTFLLSLVINFAFGPKSVAAGLIQLTLYAAFFFLVGFGIHRAQRYRLSRTRWRGIRAGLEGSSWTYAWTYFWTGLLMILTLGWASPWRATKLQGLITNAMRFGKSRFAFDAKGGPLYGRFAVLWFSAVVISLAVIAIAAFVNFKVLGLGMPNPNIRPDMTELFTLLAVFYAVGLIGFLFYSIISAWYRAHMMNHFARHTTFEGARFKGSATGRTLVSLAVGNYLMVLFTLGLLVPVAQARSARYLVEHLQIEGNVPLAQIQQRAADDIKRGEGLAQAFDFDAF
ncbi:MAG: YjgN family protein [Hyphomicrobiaceae bacterium]